VDRRLVFFLRIMAVFGGQGPLSLGAGHGLIAARKWTFEKPADAWQTATVYFAVMTGRRVDCGSRRPGARWCG